MHICSQALRQELTHVVGPKQEMGGENEEHEVDDGVQQQRLLEGALQVMACTGTNHVSHQSSRFSPITDNVAISYEGNLRVAHCVGRRSGGYRPWGALDQCLTQHTCHNIVGATQQYGTWRHQDYHEGLYSGSTGHITGKEKDWWFLTKVVARDILGLMERHPPNATQGKT